MPSDHLAPRRGLTALAALGLLLGLAACQHRAVRGDSTGLETVMVSADGRADGRPLTIEDLITARSPSQIGISPDGRWVSYVVTTPDLDENAYTHDLFIMPTDRSEPPRRLSAGDAQSDYRAASQRMSPFWAPGSDRLVFVGRHGQDTEIRTANVHTGSEAVLLTRAELGEEYDFSPSYRGSSLAFSPDGRSLAFLASRVPDPPPSDTIFHAIEADEDFRPGASRPPPAYQLFVMELGGERPRALTTDSLNVASFAWSPDGQRLAVEASTDPTLPGNYMKGDIYVVDVASGALRSLVRLDGWDRAPVWSPDGTRIAFSSQRGTEDWMSTASLAIVAADGSSPPRFIGDALDRIGGAGFSSLRWTPDGRSIHLATWHRLGKHLFRVRVDDGAVERVTPREDRYYDDFKYSRDGSLMVFTAQSAVVPPDVYVSSTESFEPRRMTNVNPEWDAIRRPHVEMVRWPSADDRWDVHGLLVMPPDYDRDRRYPMLAAILGGPTMVRQHLNPIPNYPLLTLADRGYVIFLPNSRGRPGFGVDFTHAIRDEQSYVTNPLGDVLSGVDELVRAGIAHPDSLGVLGFSYGGTLAANAITRTDRFKAALYGEGAPFIMDRMIRYLHKFYLGLIRDMWGLENLFEPAVIERTFEQSALFRLDQVRTPVLIETGELSFREGDRALYRGLQYFGVPSEFYVYPRSGHGWNEPLLKQDAYRRHIDWFDYWIRGASYPDQEKQERYDAWKDQLRD